MYAKNQRSYLPSPLPYVSSVSGDGIDAVLCHSQSSRGYGKKRSKFAQRATFRSHRFLERNCRFRSRSENVLLILDSGDFICKKCIEKTTTSTTATPTAYTSPYAVPNSKHSPSISISNEARDASKMTASYICEAEGCDKPIYHNPSDVRPLCKMHSIRERFKNSSIRKERTRPISVSKPFRKDKIYALPANDKPFVNPSLKRKRTTPRTSKNFASEDGTFASDTGRPISSPPKGVIRKVTSTTTLPLEPTPIRTLQQRGKLHNSLATIGGSNSHELDPSRSPDMINNSRWDSNFGSTTVY